MDLSSKVVLCAVMAAFLVSAQQQTAEAPSHVAFIRHLLASIADPSHDPAVCKMNEENLVSLYGLDQQEAALLHSAGLSFAAAKLSFRTQEAAILFGKSEETATDRASIATLSGQFDRQMAEVASQFLNSVRPQAATLLRRQGDVIAQFTGAAQKGN